MKGKGDGATAGACGSGAFRPAGAGAGDQGGPRAGAGARNPARYRRRRLVPDRPRCCLPGRVRGLRLRSAGRVSVAADAGLRHGRARRTAVGRGGARPRGRSRGVSAGRSRGRPRAPHALRRAQLAPHRSGAAPRGAGRGGGRAAGAAFVDAWADTRFLAAERLLERLGYRRLPDSRASATWGARPCSWAPGPSGGPWRGPSSPPGKGPRRGTSRRRRPGARDTVRPWCGWWCGSPPWSAASCGSERASPPLSAPRGRCRRGRRGGARRWPPRRCGSASRTARRPSRRRAPCGSSTRPGRPLPPG